MGVDDDLVVGGVPVVLGLLGNSVVSGRDQGAVDDQNGVLAEPPPRLVRKEWADVVDDPVGRRLGHPERRRKLPNVRLVRQ